MKKVLASISILALCIFAFSCKGKESTSVVDEAIPVEVQKTEEIKKVLPVKVSEEKAKDSVKKVK